MTAEHLLCRPAWAAVLLLAATAPTVQAAEWRSVTAPLTLELPRDHGAHPGFRTEWWYVTGHLADAHGPLAGFQVTFFRRGLDPSPPRPGASTLRARQLLAAHLAVADLRDASFVHAERARRTGPLAAASVEDLDLFVEDWTMRRAGEAIAIEAADREARIGLRLRLEPRKPLVRHGDGGVSRKGEAAANASAYLSWTRLGVSGELVLRGRPQRVTGEAWFDHEWGTSQLDPGVTGWDWFGLRLDDGRELMLFRLRRADGRPSPFSAGTLVAADGAARSLRASELALEPVGSWRSATTGATYPGGFHLRVPAAGLDLTVRPQVAAAEIDARASTGTVYWEGPVAVSGSATGQGYMELTGYAGSMAGRF